MNLWENVSLGELVLRVADRITIAPCAGGLYAVRCRCCEYVSGGFIELKQGRLHGIEHVLSCHAIELLVDL